jgi:hypothetical protein
MMRARLSIFALLLIAAIAAAAQSQAPDEPEANPARPSVSNPAALTPVGYLQFETGYLGAWHSPEFSSRPSINEVAKIAVAKRLQFVVAWEPLAYSRDGAEGSISPGGVSLGLQTVLHASEGARPTIALAYYRQLYGGNAADLDIGSALNSLILLFSGDVKGFHYDTNYVFNDVKNSPVHRAQYGQTISISHPLCKKLGLTGEIWHYTQPFLVSRAVGNLWALNYNARKNLVFDAGFDHGLTSTSTRWQVFGGVTYLLPHKLSLHRSVPHA